MLHKNVLVFSFTKKIDIKLPTSTLLRRGYT